MSGWHFEPEFFEEVVTSKLTKSEQKELEFNSDILFILFENYTDLITFVLAYYSLETHQQLSINYKIPPNLIKVLNNSINNRLSEIIDYDIKDFETLNYKFETLNYECSVAIGNIELLKNELSFKILDLITTLNYLLLGDWAKKYEQKLPEKKLSDIDIKMCKKFLKEGKCIINRELMDYTCPNVCSSNVSDIIIFDYCLYASLTYTLQDKIKKIWKKWSSKNENPFFYNHDKYYNLPYEIWQYYRLSLWYHIDIGDELHPPKYFGKYNFCGPGTKYVLRTTEPYWKFYLLFTSILDHKMNGDYPWNIGTNELDECCRDHDKCYSDSSWELDINYGLLCDRDMDRCIKAKKIAPKQPGFFVDKLRRLKELGIVSPEKYTDMSPKVVKAIKKELSKRKKLARDTKSFNEIVNLESLLSPSYDIGFENSNAKYCPKNMFYCDDTSTVKKLKKKCVKKPINCFNKKKKVGKVGKCSKIENPNERGEECGES